MTASLRKRALALLEVFSKKKPQVNKVSVDLKLTEISDEGQKSALISPTTNPTISSTKSQVKKH